MQIVDRERPDTDSAPHETDPDRWATVCEHGCWITHENLRVASVAAASPETWCGECELLANQRRLLRRLTCLPRSRPSNVSGGRLLPRLATGRGTTSPRPYATMPGIASTPATRHHGRPTVSV